VSHELLRRLPLFADLNDADLSLLEEASRENHLAADEVLMREGSPGGSLYVIIQGEFEITKRIGPGDLVLAVRGPGEVIGEMSLLDGSPRTATVRSLGESRLLEIDQAAFRRLVESSPAATLSILHTVTSRLRHTESMLRQSETLAALGTLAAGLAHELNNPAAALQRSTAQARQLLPRWQEAHARLHAAGIDQAQQPELSALASAADESPPTLLDPLTRSDQEASLQDWLEQAGVTEAWEIAPTLLASGLTAERLAEGTRRLPGSAVPAAVEWIATSRSLSSLLGEVALSAERISAIVGTVRSYSYLDQAPVQPVDVPRGLEDTLVILRSKLEPGITVHRDYAPDLPRIEAYGSELNQVWTNLIANAAEAMAGSGELRLLTRREGARILVEICDNGPGIPETIRERIFEPFFTTKPPGQGTGLGLHLTYNIVTLHHRGQIAVESRPGETCFRVLLPMQMERGPA
jgi:signal transduction histidine kinase